jgi:Flp pilus assembly secretin CpaC
LFFVSKDKDNKLEESHAPAAALTIHPVLPLTPQVAVENTAKPPTLVAMNGDLEGSIFDAASKAQQDQSSESTATISDTLTAEPAAPEPVPISGAPHGGPSEGEFADTSRSQQSFYEPPANTPVHQTIEPNTSTSLTSQIPAAQTSSASQAASTTWPAVPESPSTSAWPAMPTTAPIASAPATAASSPQWQAPPEQQAPPPEPLQLAADKSTLHQAVPTSLLAPQSPQSVPNEFKQPSKTASSMTEWTQTSPAPNPRPLHSAENNIPSLPQPAAITPQQAYAPPPAPKPAPVDDSYITQPQPITASSAAALEASPATPKETSPTLGRLAEHKAQPLSSAKPALLAERKPISDSASGTDARPPVPIFMNNDNNSAPPTPVPIASLPPIKSRHTTDARAPKQPSPEQLIAQVNPSTAASPIPPVVSGTIDLEEFKSSNVIDLKVSQSRTFRLRNKIIRTSISDPSIAEPVVVSENQMVLLGKSPGGATLVVWDDAGNSLAVDVHVERDFSQLQATLREIDPRIIVKPFSVGGSDRVILLGDVDHAESVIRAFTAANAFMDDRGMKIMAANSRLINEKLGEMPINMMLAMQGMMGGGGGGGGALSSLSQVNNFMYFSNLSGNVGKAQAIISDGGRVTSLIKVRKTPLIVLHCQFLEMNSAAVRELGVQLGMNLTSGGFSFGVGGQTGVQSGASGIGNIISTPGINGLFPSNFNAVSGQSPQFISTGGGSLASVTTPSLQGVNNGLYYGLNSQQNGLGSSTGPANFLVANSIPTIFNGQLVNMPVSQVGLGGLNGPAGLLAQSILFGLPGGATFNSSGLANLFSGVSNILSNSHYRFSLNPTINGIISHSRARVLAEPTLVTISGERAAFLAGGEIPIEQSIATAGTAQQSVVFEPFGLRLNMIPVLLENGTINLEVAPEERLLSNANAINLINIGTIPGFTTRKLQTIVELKPGQELFISGLVSSNSGRELDKTPILGEVPVLGALYRSKAFAKNESELVISVRPEIIVPGNPGQLKLPEEISKSEAARDTNIFQVEPTIIDERYMTSGQSEHPQRIPGTLAPGAPIPDNQ